jgi:sporadic carbohydrate cluster protein (TIGR04323 family)
MVLDGAGSNMQHVGDFLLGRIQKMGYDLDQLSRIHEVIPDKEVFTVTKQLCKDTHLPEFQKMVNNYVREVVVPEGDLEFPVAVQRYLNVRIMLPNKPESIFPFHTGILYGHGPGSHSLWLPFVDVSAQEDYTATMQILSIDQSRAVVNRAVEEQWSVGKMTEEFGKDSYPLLTKPGEAVFFSQENIHGNFVNTSGKTRVSMDFRIAEGRFGNYLARKIAGGYFKIIPDRPEDDDAWLAHSEVSRETKARNGKRDILYIHNATSSVRQVPVHLQRYMILEYCQNNDITYEFELFDLEDMTHLPTLQHIVNDLQCNAVLYSVFCLPEDPDFRKQIMQGVVDNGLCLHFVNEDMVLADQQDADDIEQLLVFAKHGQ